jgi:putative PIG3 family NAD(P)H quinone oxidoreductase
MQMKTVVITQPGGPEVLQLQDRPTPEPVADQVRVKVLFAGLNRADVMQRRGHYPAPPGVVADIPGLEIMGVIDAVGPQTTRWKTGQRVFGILGGGGYAEYAITHERLLAPVPDELSDEAAAAVPEAWMTAHDALFSQAELKMGERVLIHAAGSGVGTAAIQLAHAAGAQTFGTARSPQKLIRAQELGLDVALAAEEFAAVVREATHDEGVQVLIDFVGAPYFAQNLEALAVGGRLVQVGTMGGNRAEIDLGILMRKRLQLFGTVLRARSLEEKALVTRRFENHVVPLLAKGQVQPIVDRVFALHEAAQAHEYMENNSNFGKVLLRCAEV